MKIGNVSDRKLQLIKMALVTFRQWSILQWTKYFKELLNKDYEEGNNEFERNSVDEAIDFTTDSIDIFETLNGFNDLNEDYLPTIEEIIKILKENIPPEVLKYGGE